jgi:YidC/Oxa1 family membrane protein insertase
MSQPKVAANAPVSNDPSAQSMKMMQYFMPVMIAIFGWSVAAGLALYWTISSVFQAVQQYFVTGWGSLGTLVPGLGASSSSPQKNSSTSVSSNNNEKRRDSGAERRNGSVNTNTDEKASDETRESVRAERGAVASQLRTSTKPASKGNAQSSKRSRSTSASARRRSGAQRSRS